MVDISLCNGNGCNKRETCNRYLSLPVADPLWQSYISSIDCIEHDYIAYWPVNEPNPQIGQFRTCDVYVGGPSNDD